MRFTLDTHTHTIASGHAYNTIDEMAVYAARHRDLHFLCEPQRAQPLSDPQHGAARLHGTRNRAHSGAGVLPPQAALQENTAVPPA